jgi:type IV pilus assembly protein PilQ
MGNKILFLLFFVSLTETARVRANPGAKAKQDPVSSYSICRPDHREGSTSIRKRYSGKRISLFHKNADILGVLKQISEVGQFNLVVSAEVKGRLTIRMKDVPWDQALDIIISSKKLGKECYGNVIRVCTIAELTPEPEPDPDDDPGRLMVRLVPINYLPVERINTQVRKALSRQGSTVVDVRTNVLIVKDTRDYLNKIEDLVSKLDIPY